MLRIRPIKQRDAKEYIRQHHRHHRPPAGSVFQVSIVDETNALRGVAMAGRPVSRCLDDGLTIEVNRVCTDGVRNGCSMLLGACARVAACLGYARIITYTLPAEGGASLRGAGWTCEAQTRGGLWVHSGKTRKNDHPTESKHRWSKAL